jgi:hypothetical protein
MTPYLLTFFRRYLFLRARRARKLSPRVEWREDKASLGGLLLIAPEGLKNLAQG